MREDIIRVLDLQPFWSSTNTGQMQERGRLVRDVIPGYIRLHASEFGPLIPKAAGDLVAQGKDGTGQRTQIPWVRVAGATMSPNARTGWYVVYLFDAPGEAVYLSLNQGTTVFRDGQFIPLPTDLLRQRVAWAKSALDGGRPEDDSLQDEIALKATHTNLGAAYEQGNVCALRYDRDAMPTNERLVSDLAEMLGYLARVYRAETRRQAPGESPAEIRDAEAAVHQAAGKRSGGSGYRQSAAQRRVIEMHAMRQAREALRADGWTVKDVSASASCDYEARRAGEVVYIEVKGTTGDGGDVLVTPGEVALARREGPRAAIFIVSNVELLGEPDNPRATGGVLRRIWPWAPSADDLTPLGYRWRTGMQ